MQVKEKSINPGTSKFYNELKKENVKTESKIKKILIKKKPICLRYTHLNYCACVDSFCKKPSKLIKINEKIYISTLPSVFNPENLKDLKIKNILNLTSSQFTKNNSFIYKSFSFKENRNQDFLNFFRNTNRFIKNGKEDEKVLIISNTFELSVVFIIAFFLYSKKISLIDIINDINNILEDNEIFDFFITQYNLDQLKFYEKQRDEFNQEKNN